MAVFNRSRKGPDYELLPTSSQQGKHTQDPPEKPPIINLYCSKPAKRLTAAVVIMFGASVLFTKYGRTSWKASPEEEGLPDYADIWKLERQLPQHKMNLPFPEGYHG